MRYDGVVVLISIYILKEWIVFFARSDWLLNLPIFSAIH